MNRETGNQRIESFTLCHLARAVAALDGFATALPHFQYALERSRQTRDRHVEAWALDYLGTAVLATDQPAQAATHWSRALDLFTELRDPQADDIRARISRLPVE